jgi:hypothetical protein
MRALDLPGVVRGLGPEVGAGAEEVVNHASRFHKKTVGGEKKFVGTLAGEVVVIGKHGHQKSGVFGEHVGVLKADVFAVKRGGERESLYGNVRGKQWGLSR